MNDQKSNDIIKPKISTELDNGNDKLYTFDSSHSKSFTFENGQLKEHTDNEGNEQGLSKKNTQFQKPLPPTPGEKGKVNNNNNNNKNKNKSINNIKTTDNDTITTNTTNSKTPYNTPNQQYQTLEEAHNNPVDFSRFKDSIAKIQDPKKGGSDTASTNDPNKEIADNLGLKHINKNPNVGNEQFFTSFQKYATNNSNNEPLPKANKK